MGSRIPLRGQPPMDAVGHAVHAFFAADRDKLDHDARYGIAASILARHGVSGAIDPDEVLAAATRLWDWIESRFGAARIHREWPVSYQLPAGPLISGTADLIIRTNDGTHVVDHKTFPGSVEQALDRVVAYSGQLDAYARALTEALHEPLISTWIHLPVPGVVIEMKLAPTVADGSSVRSNRDQTP
jgi:ATP-dependent exoDNAse (exonuclease V) beta subunit